MVLENGPNGGVSAATLCHHRGSVKFVLESDNMHQINLEHMDDINTTGPAFMWKAIAPGVANNRGAACARTPIFTMHGQGPCNHRPFRRVAGTMRTFPLQRLGAAMSLKRLVCNSGGGDGCLSVVGRSGAGGRVDAPGGGQGGDLMPPAGGKGAS